MSKKKQIETQEDQSKRFREAVREAIAARELNPTEAESALEEIIFSQRNLDR